MQTIAGPNTNALRSITGYNVGSPLRKMPEMTQGQVSAAAGGAAALGSDIGAISSDQIPAQSAKGEGGRILGETAKYAAMGMAFGPIGAGVGALVGLTVGLVKNKKAKDAHKEQMAANDKLNKANAAQQALAANVNSQKAPATMKSPNERSKAPNKRMEPLKRTMAPNKRMEPLKRTMAPVKMAPLKRELSSIQASSSYMRTPASSIERQEIMRTLSGASALKRNVGVTEGGKKFIKSETKGITVYDDGSDSFDQQYQKAKFKADKEAENQEKREYAKANPKEAAKVSAENLKGKSEEEKAKIIAEYRAKKSQSEKQLASK